MRRVVHRIAAPLDGAALQTSFDATGAPRSSLVLLDVGGGLAWTDVPPSFVSWLVAERGCEVGLLAPPGAPVDGGALERLVAAGLTVFEQSVVGGSRGAEGVVAALRAVRALADRALTDRSLANRHPAGGARRFPAVEVVARVLLDRPAIADAEGTLAVAAAVAPDAHRLRYDLWPRTTRRGALVLPDFAALADLVPRLLEADGRAWRDGGASVGLGAWSGFPACLFRDDPALLRWLRLPPAPPPDDGPRGAEPPASARPTLPVPLCRTCALRRWCPPAVAGAPGRRLLRPWLGDLRPFDAVPASVAAPVDSAPRADGGDERRGHHVPRSRHTPYDVFAREHADAFLWDTAAARRLELGVADLPPRIAAAEGFPVLLVRVPGPPIVDEHGSVTLPPLSLVHLGSMLEAYGFPTTVRDLAAEANVAGLQDPHGRVDRAAIRAFVRERLAGALADGGGAPARLVAVSVEYAAAADVAAEALTSVGHDGFTVLGGRAMGAALDTRDALARWPHVDFLVEGEGEAPLVMLANALAEGRAPRAVPGLTYRHAGRIVRLPPVTHDLAALAPPSLGWVDPALYPNVHRDNRKAFGDDPVATHLFVRGCPFRCAFCGDYSEGRFSARPPDRVGADLERLCRAYGATNLLFLNTLVNPTRRYLAGLLDELERRALPIRFADSAKPRGLTRDDLQRLRRAGCTMLTWGIDTGSERMARLMNKGVGLDEATRVLRDSHEAGITNTVNLIQGMPHETDDDVAQTVAWVRANRPYIWRVRLARYEFLGNSPLFLFPERFGLRKRADGRSFDEVDGLAWEEKQRQMDGSLARVRATVEELGLAWE